MLLNEFVAFGHANADWIALSLIEGASPVKQSSLVKRGFHLHESSYLLEVQ